MAPIETQTLNEGSEKLLSFHYADHADPMKVTVVWPPPPGSSTDYLTQALAKRGVSDIQDENAEVADHAAGKLLVKDCMRLAIGNQYNDSVISHYAEALNEWS